MDANIVAGAGGAAPIGTGGFAGSSDGGGGIGGATIPPASNGGAGYDVGWSIDASVDAAGGTTVPVTSTGGAGGATMPITSTGGAGGATVPITSTGGAGGATVPVTSTGGAGGATVPITSTGGAGGATVPVTSTGGAGGATSTAICGNNQQEGAEGCDDGNRLPFDGCSASCQLEPDCSGGACTSPCGDGIVFGGEECDDANHASGDGCSADCKTEPGWACTKPAVGDKILVPTIYRDFRARNPVDFESGKIDTLSVVPGMVNATLGADGKPVYSGLGGSALVASAETFAQWYRDIPGVNHTTSSTLALWSNGKGGFVNRYRSDGGKWNVTEVAYFCGYVGQERLDDAGNAIPCTTKNDIATDCTAKLAAGQELLACTVSADVYRGTFIVSKVDGNPVFFPVDDDTFTPISERLAAQIPPYYDATSSWPYDVDAAGNKIQHNFSFTTEVRHFFVYDKSKTYSLDFVGDDDVWVFIGRKLAVDLGGIHPPVEGNLVIGPDGNGSTIITPTYPTPDPRPGSVALGLETGQLYEIAVFQAERQSTGSSFKLTLTGFDMAPSQCVRK